MATYDKHDRPDYKSAAYQRQAKRWEKIDDLCAGADALRDKKYIPQRFREHDQQYDDRKRKAMLVPVFDDNVTGAVGLVFREEPKLADDVPPIIKAQLENVDLAGTHWTVFAKDAFDIAARKGHGAILVEFPKRLGNEADASQDKRRPYWVKYSPEQILNPRMVNLDGQVHLDQITFKETKTEARGMYGEEDVTRYRTFRRETLLDEFASPYVEVTWIVEQEVTDGEGKTHFEIVDSGTTGLDEIPVSVIYGQKVDWFESYPPFYGVAELNLMHWEKTADYNQNISVNQYNHLAVIGGEETDNVEAGPHGVTYIKTGGDMKYVAPDSNIIQLALDDLLALEKRMQQMGVNVLMDGGDAAKTATEVEVEHGRRTSKLSSMVKSLKDCLERCLYFHGLYLNIENTGSVIVGASIDDAGIDTATMQLLLQAVESGNLTKETWLKIIGNELPMPEDYDAEEEAAELNENEESMMGEITKDEATAKPVIRTKGE